MDAFLFAPMRAGRRLVRAALGAALAVGASAFAQIVAVPAAILSHAEGSVAVAPRGDNEWTDAAPRRALARGDRVWTDRGSRAEVQAGLHLVRIDGQSQVTVESVEGGSTQVSLLRGTLAVAVSKLQPADNVEIGTPHLAFRARQPGDYRIDVDTNAGTTRVSVMSGAAIVYGEHGQSVDLAAGQRLTFTDRSLAKAPTPAFTAVDEFDRWMVARGRAPAAPAAQVAPQVHPDAVARRYREQEAQRQAQIKLELQELKKLKQLQAAGKLPRAPHGVQAAAATPATPATPGTRATPASPVASAPAAPLAQAKPGPRPVEPAPRIVQVPRAAPQPAPQPAAQAAAPSTTAQAAAKRADEDRRIAEATRAAKAQQARREQDERRALMAKRAEQEKRVAAAAAKKAAEKAAEEKRIAELAAKREAEQKRVAAAKRAEQEKRAALARKAEQDRKLAQARRAEKLAQEQAIGEARAKQLVRLQQQAATQEQSAREQTAARQAREEQARKEAHARKEEEARREEVARREEEARREAWERRQKALAEQEKRDHEVWLRAQQPSRPAPQGVPARRVM